MAEEANQNKRDQEAEAAVEEKQPQTSGKLASWRRFLTAKWIAIVIVASIVIHGIGFAYFRLAHNSPPATSSPEVSLGVYRFKADKNEAGRITNAEFSLHIALLEHVDQVADGGWRPTGSGSNKTSKSCSAGHTAETSTIRISAS